MHRALPKPARDLHALRCSGVGGHVTFEAGSATITGDTRDALAVQAAWLKQHSHVKVTIAGNGDERGTQDYNFALGYRRASAGRDILIDDGIENDRIAVLSYGGARTGPTKVAFGSAVTSVQCASKSRPVRKPNPN